MSEYAQLLFKSFLIGIAVAAPVGAMGVLCIQRTLAGGWRAGAATGLGIATMDGAYAALAAFGVTAVSALVVELQAPLRLIGGAALVYLGIRSAMATVPQAETKDVADLRHPARLYLSAVALTATNPMTIMAFGAVFASAGLAVTGGWRSALLATVGVAWGSLAWWLGLVTGVAFVRHSVSPRAMSWVNRASGGAVALFGVLAIVSAISGL